MKRFLAGVLPVLSIAAIALPAAAAPAAVISSNRGNICFSSTVPSAPPGSAILNCLGYFVSMKSAGKSEIGTVFVHGNSMTGRSYYAGLEKSTGKIGKQGRENDGTEVRIPERDIVSAFQRIYGGASAREAENIFEKKTAGSCTVSTLMCMAKLAGNGVPSQPGWNQKLKCGEVSYPELGITQVRLKQANPGVSDIKSDLEILNGSAGWKKASAQNSRLKCFEINPSRDLTSGGAVISVTNGQGGFRQYGNLNCGSAFRSLPSEPVISGSYYGLVIQFIEIQKKTAPYQPGKVGTVEYTVDSASRVSPKAGTVGETGVNHIKVFTFGAGGCLLLFLTGLLAWKAGKNTRRQ